MAMAFSTAMGFDDAVRLWSTTTGLRRLIAP
jgi:hypothetical protein